MPLFGYNVKVSHPLHTIMCSSEPECSPQHPVFQGNLLYPGKAKLKHINRWEGALYMHGWVLCGGFDCHPIPWLRVHHNHG